MVEETVNKDDHRMISNFSFFCSTMIVSDLECLQCFHDDNLFFISFQTAFPL